MRKTTRSTYTAARAAEICNRIAGGEPLRSICRDPSMPVWQTVYNWLQQYPDFAARFVQAREVGYDAIAEEALAIADTPLIGEETVEDGKGGCKVRRRDMVEHRKLQVETRLKLLAKWYPKKYGDKSSMELTGAGGGPLQISDTERAARLSSLLDMARRRLGESPDREGGS